MTKVQGQDIFTGHKQSFVSNLSFYHFPYEMWFRQELYISLNNDLELAQPTFDQVHDTSSGHKQFLCEVGTFNVSS